MISKKIKNNIIIYGSSGFIGSNLIDHLNTKKFNYLSVARRKNFISKNHLIIKNYNEVDLPKKVLKKNCLNTLFYLCAETSVNNVNKNTEKNLKDSLLPIINLFRYSQKHNIRIKLIFSSTITVFGSKKLIINKYSKPDPETFFDTHKFFVEQYLKFLSKNEYFKYTIIRLPNIYGPGRESISKKSDRGVLNKIILNSIKKNDPIYIYGSGNNYRDFIFINDISDLLLKVMLKPKKTENLIFNLSTFSQTTLRDFFNNLILGLNKFEIHRILKNIPWPKYSIPINKRSYKIKDNNLLKSIGWRPKTNLKKGINETIKIYKNEIN